MTPAFIAVAAVAIAAIFTIARNASRGSIQMFELMEQQRLAHQADAAAQERTFQRAVLAVSDATAKAVQSITYPEALSTSSQVPNGELPAVREMPVRERDMTWDFSDPTDAGIPDPVLRPDSSMLGDPHSPMGIPGFQVDPNRYDGPGVRGLQGPA